MEDKDETNLFFKLIYNDQSEEIIPTKDFESFLNKICTVLPIEKEEKNFLEIYHNGNLINNENDYLKLFKSEEFQIDLNIINKKNAKNVPENINAEKSSEKNKKENNEININQILDNQKDNNNNFNNNNNDINNLLTQINERISKMEQNINNKISQESKNISIKIDEKIDNLKKELINNLNITNSEVNNIKKDLLYLPQKINNIQLIVSDLSLLPNAFKENTNNIKYEINEIKKNMNTFFTQFSDNIKQNNNNNNNFNLNNNYNQINFNNNNNNNYPLINENDNNNYNNINNQKMFDSDDDSDDNQKYNLKVKGDVLEYSYDQYNKGELQFEIVIENEGDCFPKHLKITCEPNGLLYFDPLEINITNINEKEFKYMIYLKKNGNIKIEGDNFLLCNILDRKNRQITGILYNLIFH